MSNVPRIGLNLGLWKTQGAQQFSSNVLMNPGFEPLLDRAIVIVKETASGGFSDNDPTLARPDNFWNGATFQVRTGISAGQGGTIATSLASDAGGLPWFTTGGAAPAVVAGDAIALTQTQTSGAPSSWTIPSTSNGLVAITLDDSRPGSPGHSAADLTLKSGHPTEIDAYLDNPSNTIPGGKFLPVNGGWQLSFWARATAGAPNLQAQFLRFGSTAFLDQTVSLTNAWQFFIFPFSASDTGAAGILAFKFKASGSDGENVRLDDVQLGRVSDLGNAWRAEVIRNLQTLKPGYLRDLQLQLGDTITNRLAPPFARQPQRWQPASASNLYQYLYSVPELLDLCHQVGAQPWIVLPSALYDEEFTQLGDYLASAQATYGFSDIVVEFGNESWNSDFRAGSIPAPMTMGEAANRGFGLLRSATGPTVPLHLVVNGRFMLPQWSSVAINSAPEADAVGVAPYFFQNSNATDSQATSLAAMFQTADETSSVTSLQSSIGSSKAVDAYELNFITLDGSASAAQRDALVGGMVSGAALANRLVAGLNLGLRRQMVYALSGYNFPLSAALGNIDLFGVTRDLAAAGNLRPTGLAVQMINDAIAGDLYHVTPSGAAANGIKAVAFKSPAGWSLVVVSSLAAPTTITVTLPTSGASPTRAQTLSAASLTADNESTTDVTVESLTTGPNLRVTIPPYGVVTLTA